MFQGYDHTYLFISFARPLARCWKDFNKLIVLPRGGTELTLLCRVDQAFALHQTFMKSLPTRQPVALA